MTPKLDSEMPAPPAPHDSHATAPENMQESNGRLKAMLEALPDLLFVLDRDGRICDFHAPNPDRLYVPPEQFLGRPMNDVLPEPAAGIVNRAIADAVAHGHHRGSVYPLHTPAGEQWFEISIAAQGDLQTPHGRLVAIVRDVTERKQAEDALRQNEQRLRQIIDLVPHFIFAKDAEGRFILANQAVAEAYGTTVHQLIGKTDSHFDGSENEVRHFREDDLAVLASGRPLLVPEETITDSQHRQRILSTTKIPFACSDPPVPAILGVSVDITDRKQAEKALRQSEQKYRLLTEGMKDVVWTVDIEAQRFIYVSPSVHQLRGFTPEEIFAQPLAEAWAPEQRQELAGRMAHYLAEFQEGRLSTDTYVTLEILQPCKDGSRIPSEVVCHLVRNEQTGRIELHGVTRDISDRKRMEETLRESESRFAQSAKASHAYVWEVDAYGVYTFISPVVQEVLGYAPDEIVGKLHYYDFHPPEGREEFKEASLRLFQQAQPISDFENLNVAKDGRRVWVSSSAAPLFKMNGALCGYQGVDMDITARKQAEEALRESETRFNNVAQTSRAYTWEVDAQGLLTYVSPVVEDVLGYRPDEIVGRMHFYDFQPPEDFAEFKAMGLQFLRQAMPISNFENPNQTKGGRRVWTSSSATPLFHADGTLRGYQGVDIDITARKQVEAALRESETRFAQSAKQSRTYVWEMDADGLFTFISHVVEDVLGYRPDEVVGTLHFYDLHPEGGRAAFLAAAQDVIQRKAEFTNLENPCQTKDGRIAWVSTNGWPLLNADGSLRGYRGSDLDITERKQAEAALLESTVNLRATLNATTDGILAVGPDRKILFFSQRFSEMWKIPPALMATQDDQALIDHVLMQLSDPEAFLKGVRRLYESDESGFDVIHFRDGRVLERYSFPLLTQPQAPRGRVWTFRDITKRNQAEEALKTSETRYRELIDFAVDGILLGSHEGFITEANACMCALAGRTRAELVGMHVFGLFDPESREQAPLRFDLLHEGLPVVRERKLRRPDGSEVFVEMHTKMMPDGTYQSIYRDISQRKQAAQALQLSEAKYRRLHEGMRDAFVSTDMQGHILETNAAFLVLTGYCEEEIRDLTYLELTPAKWHAREAKILAEQVVPRGYSDVYQKEYTRKDGSVVPIELRTILIRDAYGNPVGMWALVRDITERKQVERALQRANDELERRVAERTAALVDSQQALQQSEAQFRQMTDIIQEVFWLVDAQTGHALYVSPAFEAIWGRPPRKENPGVFAWADSLHPEDRERALQSFQRGLATGQFDPLEVRVLRPDGATRWIEIHGWMVHPAHEEPLRIAGVMRDITERRRLEAEILRASDAERQRIGRDLHDSLGQVLTGIGYLAEALRGELARHSRPEAGDAKKLGRLIENAANQAHAMAQGMLLTDLHRGGLAAALQELALRTEELFGVPCRYAGLAAFDGAPADALGQLYRIAQEAATNAAKHAKAREIEIRLARTKAGLLLTVRDAGTGISPKKRKHDGLGLEIMKYRANQIGATLDIASTRNQGTTVTCRLPLAAPPEMTP